MFAIHFGDFNNGNIKRATAQIVHGDFAFARLFIHTKCQRRCGRFVDNALYIQTGNLASVFGSLAL